MAKNEIKNLVENSKKILDQEHEAFAKSINDELKSFKKRTLDRI